MSRSVSQGRKPKKYSSSPSSLSRSRSRSKEKTRSNDVNKNSKNRLEDVTSYDGPPPAPGFVPRPPFGGIPSFFGGVPAHLGSIPAPKGGVPPPLGAVQSPYGGVPPPLGVVPPPLGVVPPPFGSAPLPRGIPPPPPPMALNQSSGSRLPPPPLGVAPSWQSFAPKPALEKIVKPTPIPTNTSVKLSLNKGASVGGVFGSGGAADGGIKKGESGGVAKKPKLAQVFNAEDSSDEEEIPPEARYKYYLIFQYSQPCQGAEPCTGVCVRTELSSWEDFVLQNENEKRRSGNCNLQRTEQFWEDPTGLYRHQQVVRKTIAGGHGRCVQRQQGPAQDQQVDLFIWHLKKFQIYITLLFVAFNPTLVFR